MHTADDIKGLKIAASGKVMADDLKLMGAAAITINPGDFFEALNRGLAAGVLISWPGAESFKLQDVAKYHMSTPFGLFPAFIAMNKASYAKLSGDAKSAIDNLSGETLSKRIGVGLDKSNDATIAMFKKLEGHEVRHPLGRRAEAVGRDARARHAGLGEAHARRRRGAVQVPRRAEEDPVGVLIPAVVAPLRRETTMRQANWLRLAAVAALLALPAAPRAAEPITLKFAWPAPVGTDSSDIGLGWKDDIVKAAGGLLKVQVYPGAQIAKTTNVLDRVENGVADIGFGIFGPYSRTFPQTFVVELPFSCKQLDRMLDGAVAAQRVGRHLRRVQARPPGGAVLLHRRQHAVDQAGAEAGGHGGAEDRRLGQGDGRRPEADGRSAGDHHAGRLLRGAEPRA